MNTETRTVEPDQPEAPAGAIRFLVLPGPDLFTRRAERFRALTADHPLGDYLAFLALLADAQQEALDRAPAPPRHRHTEQAFCREHDMPLLSVETWRRNPDWRQGLATILQRMAGAYLPPAARETVTVLRQARDAWLEETADRILTGNLVSIAPQVLPFVAAALQVYWVNMAGGLDGEACGRREQGGVCPVCGSYPNVGIISNDAHRKGLRYLCCSLCGSQWHMVRLTCSSCESTGAISHYTLEGSNGAVKAESCDDCNSYLKLLYLEKDSRMEATADDLATLALDMLMDNEGKVRSGPNLLYHPGRSH